MRVHIEFVTKHLDVDSSQPGAEEGPTGPIVHRWKWHASWVQNVVRQFGFYLQEVWKLRKSISSMQRPWWIDHWCTNCHRPGLIAKRNAIAIVCLRHRWVATSRIDNCWKNRSKKRFSKHIFVHVEDHNINRQDVFTLQRVYLSVLVRIHMRLRSCVFMLHCVPHWTTHICRHQAAPCVRKHTHTLRSMMSS